MLMMLSILLFASCFLTSPTTYKSDPFWNDQKQKAILKLDDAEDTSIKSMGAVTIDLENVGDNSSSIELKFHADQQETGFEYRPKEPIDASEFENFCLIFDATNTTPDYSVQLFVVVESADGGHIRRSDVIPIDATHTYYFELEGEHVSTETGMRDDPQAWDIESRRMKIDGLKADVDFSKIAAIKFYASHTIAEKSIIIENVRLVESPLKGDDYLVGIIDKYGQAEKLDFKDKITSDDQLRSHAQKELETLEEEGPMSGRSKFGGWLDGPK